jgi:hypothetical protein
MKMKRYLALTWIAFFVPGAVWADPLQLQVSPPTGGYTSAAACNGTICPETEIFQSVFTEVFTVITLVAGILAVLFVVYNGIRYITAAGDPAKAKIARGNIINSLVGVVIAVLAYAIVHFAQALGSILGSL